MNEPNRRRLPDMRPAMTHKVTVDGHEFFVSVSFYDDDTDRGQPAEVFVTTSKSQATAVNAMIQAWAISLSMSMQYGVPWHNVYVKFCTGDPLTKGLADAINSCVLERRRVIGIDEEPGNAAPSPPPRVASEDCGCSASGVDIDPDNHGDRDATVASDECYLG